MKALFLTRNKTSVQMGTRYEQGRGRANFIFEAVFKAGLQRRRRANVQGFRKNRGLGQNFKY